MNGVELVDFMSFIFGVVPAASVTVQFAWLHFVFDEGVHVNVLVVADRLIQPWLLLDPVRLWSSLLNSLVS